MSLYYQDDSCTIYHGNCLEILPTLADQSIDLMLTDPPYGINWKPRVNHQDQIWHDSNIVPFPLAGSRNCIWGGNYYANILPVSESWIIWLKRPAGFDNDPRSYSPCEMAWSDFGGKPRTFTHVWDGGKRKGAKVNRTFNHPAQKPLELMLFCMQLDESKGLVVDPFMGSGTTLEAAKQLGRKSIGIELEEKYCEIAAERLQQEYMQF